MNLSLTAEQEMLREAARDALSRMPTVANAREALDGAPLIDLWPTASAAGWTGLLVSEDHGGVGLGLFDAMLVLEQCGRRLAGAGLLGHLVATSLFADESLASGERRAAAVFGTFEVGSDGRVSGSARFVPDAAGADVLVIIGNGGDVVMLDAEAEGVEVERVVRYDATRPLGHVVLAGARGRVLEVEDQARNRAWYVAQALLAADALGVTEEMLELSVAYAKDRSAFGRAIGSYQAIKQQIVEILRHAGTTRSLCFYVGLANDSRPEELPLAASAARFAGEEASDYATRTCIAVHGGIGATWEHDAHLYWRRAQLSRLLLGGVADAADRVAEEIIGRAEAAAAAGTIPGAPSAAAAA